MLTKSLYIDVTPFQKLQIPNYIKIWDKLTDIDGQLSSRRGDIKNLLKYQNLKIDLILHLDGLEQTYFYKKTNTKYAYSILSLL